MKARQGISQPPISGLDKPLFVLRMNWWHWSDASRLKWLKVLKTEMAKTYAEVNAEIKRLEQLQ